ncbi:MAG: hypothetical protein K2W82_01905 [Candidatus Obscuribacterales bacterium]|nr:hypothetical protein [Candidatus Obscuribacterales bacterium]
MHFIITAFILFFFCSEPSYAQATQMLQGHVEHQDSLPPLETSLQAGSRFDTTKLKALSPDNLWYQIPSWMAGTWKTTTDTNYYRYSYKTGGKNFAVDTFNCLSQSTIGWQKDRNGQIWEHANSPYLTFAELDHKFDIDLIKQKEIVDTQAKQITIYYRGARLVVSKHNKLITDSYQLESIQTYTPFGNNLLKVDASVKIFDSYGRPERLAKALSFEQRIKPFEPWNVYKGRNMVALFREYLITHNLADLLPADKAQIKSANKSRLHK